MNTGYVLINILLGAVGLGYVTYGKQQKRAIALLSGLGLLVLPYFISTTYVLILVSIVMIILPFLIKI